MKTEGNTGAKRWLNYFDLAVTGWLAVPGLSLLFIDLMYWCDARLGFVSAYTPFDPLQQFMLNLAGVLGVCWNYAHLRHGRLLSPIDAMARVAVAALILYYVFVQGATPVLLAFVVSELVGVVVHLRGAGAVEGQMQT